MISSLTHPSGKYWSYPKNLNEPIFPDPDEHLVGFIVSEAPDHI